MKQSRAFSLIELIVVICIMGIFAALAIPSMFSWTESSQIKADIATSLELHQIISDAVKSNDVKFASNTGLLTWNATAKAKLRSLIMREMGTDNYNKVRAPRQNGFAFFVYLLPPYTIVCLPINPTSDFDSSLSFNGVTEKFLLERYPKASYPQMYTSGFSTTIDPDTSETIESIGIPELLMPNILLPYETADATKLNSYIGCLNIKTDYD